MAKGYVYFRDGLDEDGRDALLADLPGLEAVIHYSANRIRFEKWRPDALAPTGRAFGPELEVRWRPGPNGVEMLVIGEEKRDLGQGWDEDEMDVDEADADEDSEKREEVYLWGAHWRSLEGAAAAEELPDGWVAAQVEADLDYPVNGGAAKPRVVAQVRTYRQNGVARLTRFLKVRPVEQEKE